GNRGGAGGALGSALVAKAEPDGYSILAQSSALAIAPAIFPSTTFDATRDLASVLMIGSSANAMIVPNARPWKTIQDFIADAKAKPGSISLGSVGIGSAVHISTEKFRFAAGIDATHVPDPAMQASLTRLGIERMPMRPAEMEDLVRRETAANLGLIKAAGIKP